MFYVGFNFVSNLIVIFRRTCSFMDFKEILFRVIQKNKNPVLFSMMVWSIWAQRNQVWLNKPHFALNLIASSAKDCLDEFAKAQPDASPPQQKTRVSW